MGGAHEFEWRGKRVVVFSVDERDPDDLVYCAHVSKKYPLWQDGLLLCCCCDILTAEAIAKAFLKEGVLYLEQVCYARVPEYSRVYEVKVKGMPVQWPILPAYGLYKDLVKWVEENFLRTS